MPTNKRESLIFTIIMCFFMVLAMELYNTAFRLGGMSNACWIPALLELRIMLPICFGDIYIVTLIPAMFMTAVCVSFLLVSNNAFGLSSTIGYVAAVITFILSGCLFFAWRKRNNRTASAQ